MSESFIDGGHDHGGHLHSHHGGEGLGLFEHGHQHHHQGILGQLFNPDGGHEHGAHGDHGSHSGHHHHHSGELSQTPQGSASWSSALKGVKLTDALQGINITPNMMLLFLFLGFGAWLFVVYWIRHHEPLANQVMGTGAALSATGHADRKLVAGVRNALPIRTTPTSGMIYVPNVPAIPEEVSAAHLPAHVGAAAGGAYASPIQHAAPLPHGAHPAVPLNAISTPRGAYNLPLYTPDGLRVKTVVQR